MVRKAVLADVPAIHALVDLYARRGLMLPLAAEDVEHTLRDFFVCEAEGRLAGTAALNISWKGMAEVRSLAVSPEMIRQGVGSALVRACLDEARELGIERVFALTYEVEFFKRQGFHVIDKKTLPHKIWGDCARCVKFPDCDETAVIIELD